MSEPLSRLNGKRINAVSFTQALRENNFRVTNRRAKQEASIEINHPRARDFAALLRFSGKRGHAVVTRASIVAGPSKLSAKKADGFQELLQEHIAVGGTN